MAPNGTNLNPFNSATASPDLNTTPSTARPLSQISLTTNNRTSSPPHSHPTMRAAALAVMGAKKFEAIIQDVDITATNFRLNLLKLIKLNQEPSAQTNSNTFLQSHENLLNRLITNVTTIISSDDSRKSRHLNEMLPAFVHCFPKEAQSSGDLLNCLSIIMQKDRFSQSLSTQKHKALAQTIGHQLAINDSNRELLTSLTLNLLSKNDANLKPYIKTLLAQLLNSLPENGERETVLYTLAEQPGFLAHLDTRQQHQLMSLFKQKIAAPFQKNTDGTIDLTSQRNITIHQQRAIYLHLANTVVSTQLDQQQGTKVSAHDRTHWFSTLNTAIGTLYHQSLYLKKDIAQLTLLIEHSLDPIPATHQAQQALGNQDAPPLERTLHSTLSSLKSTLNNYRENHSSLFSSFGTEARCINKMIRRLGKYEALAEIQNNRRQEMNAYRQEMAAMATRIQYLESQLPQTQQTPLDTSDADDTLLEELKDLLTEESMASNQSEDITSASTETKKANNHQFEV